MIPKGNQRGGGRQLATHLLNRFDNEHVEVAELRGSVAPDLHGAFAEWYAQSKATKCRKFLYSLSVNPDLAKYDLTREQYLDFVARVERSLKLVGQPRAVVFHIKQGREHCHTVWSRIDVDAGKAVHLAKDRMKLRAVAQEFARDHGLTLPRGMQKDGTKDRFNERAKQSDLKEKQQQERSGISKEERMRAIGAAWKEHKDPRAFVQALEERGYYLARGDSGRYVVIDRAGEVHSLYRQIEGVQSKEMKAFLTADYPLDTLRDVETARAAARQPRDAGKETEPPREEPHEAPAQEKKTERDAAGKHEQDEAARRAALGTRQEERRSQLARERAGVQSRHAAERQGLTDLHQSEDRGILSARAFRQPKGLRAFLLRVTGFQMIISARHRREDAVRTASQGQQKEALERRHGRELQETDRKYKALAAVEKRERHSLETALKREKFQRSIAPRQIDRPVSHDRQTAPVKPAPGMPRPAVKPAFDRAAWFIDDRQGSGGAWSARKGQVKREFEAAAADPTKQQQKTGDSRAHGPEDKRDGEGARKGDLSALLNKLADQTRGWKGALRDALTRATEPVEKRPTESEPANPRLEEARRLRDAIERRRRQDEKSRGPDKDRDR